MIDSEAQGIIDALKRYAFEHGYFNDAYDIFLEGANQGIKFFSRAMTIDIDRMKGEQIYATVDAGPDDILEDRTIEEEVYEAGNDEEASTGEDQE